MFAPRTLAPALLAPVLLGSVALCAACSGSPSAPAQTTVLKLSYDDSGLSAGPMGSNAAPYDPLTMTMTQTDGYACFSLGGQPVVWPTGYSAQVVSNGQQEVLDNNGNVFVQNNQPYNVELRSTTDSNDPCNPTGQMVLSIEQVTPGS